MRSTGGEQEITAAQLQPFEGLVHSTARMFARQVHREEDDLAQEIRIVVWRAVRKYGRHDPRRSEITLRRYVFGAVANKMRDYKRDAAREAGRRERHEVSFFHIEDMRLPGRDSIDTFTAADSFDSLFHFVERDEVYGEIEEGKFVLPSSVTLREANVLILLMLDFSKAEVMLRLGMSRLQVEACIKALQEKFADWAPGQRADSSQVVALAELREAMAA